MNTLKAISIINWIFLFATYLMYAQEDIMLGLVNNFYNHKYIYIQDGYSFMDACNSLLYNLSCKQ